MINEQKQAFAAAVRANLPSKDYFIGKPIPGNEPYIVAEFIAGGGNGLVFRAYSKQLQNNIACKIIPTENLIGRDENPPTWYSEFQRANVVASPAVVKAHSFVNWKDSNAGIDCVAVLSDYVPGFSLRQYIKTQKNAIRLNFIEQFLREMLDVLNAFAIAGVSHGDLHEGNILVEERPHALNGPKMLFRVTDFGVVAATDGSALQDDYEMLAYVLKLLLSNVQYFGLNARDRYIYNFLNDIFLTRYLCDVLWKDRAGSAEVDAAAFKLCAEKAEEELRIANNLLAQSEKIEKELRKALDCYNMMKTKISNALEGH